MCSDARFVTTSSPCIIWGGSLQVPWDIVFLLTLEDYKVVLWRFPEKYVSGEATTWLERLIIDTAAPSDIGSITLEWGLCPCLSGRHLGCPREALEEDPTADLSGYHLDEQQEKETSWSRNKLENTHHLQYLKVFQPSSLVKHKGLAWPMMRRGEDMCPANGCLQVRSRGLENGCQRWHFS